MHTGLSQRTLVSLGLFKKTCNLAARNYHLALKFVNGSRSKQMNFLCLHLPLPALSTPVGIPGPSVCSQGTNISTGLTNPSQPQNSSDTTYYLHHGAGAGDTTHRGALGWDPSQVYLILIHFFFSLEDSWNFCKILGSFSIHTQPGWLSVW